MSAPRGGGVCSRGVPGPGRGVPGPGGLLPRGKVVVFQHALRQTPRGQTDTCKNITFATSLRTVKISYVANLVKCTSAKSRLCKNTNREFTTRFYKNKVTEII